MLESLWWRKLFVIYVGNFKKDCWCRNYYVENILLLDVDFLVFEELNVC